MLILWDILIGNQRVAGYKFIWVKEGNSKKIYS